MTLASKSNELLDLLISLSDFPVTFFLQKHINAKYENTLCGAIKSSIIQIHSTIMCLQRYFISLRNIRFTPPDTYQTSSWEQVQRDKAIFV